MLMKTFVNFKLVLILIFLSTFLFAIEVFTDVFSKEMGVGIRLFQGVSFLIMGYYFWQKNADHRERSNQLK